MKADIEKKELYVWREKGDIYGVIVLSPEMDEEYIPVSWLTPGEKNLYPTREYFFPMQSAHPFYCYEKVMI